MRGYVTALIDGASDNLRVLLLLAGGYWYLTSSGRIEPVVDVGAILAMDVPIWTQLLAVGIAAAIVVGWIAGGSIWGLLPEAPHVILLQMHEEEDIPKRGWFMSPDLFAEVDVYGGGGLHKWKQTKVPVYECLKYHREENRAKANWKREPPASDLAGKEKIEDVQEEIADLRSAYVGKARVGEYIKRRIATIVRHKDFHRAKDQNRALEGHLLPEIEDEPSTDEIIADVIGDAAPDYMTGDDDSDPEAEFDILEGIDEDVLEPVEPDGGEVDP